MKMTRRRRQPSAVTLIPVALIVALALASFDQSLQCHAQDLQPTKSDTLEANVVASHEGIASDVNGSKQTEEEKTMVDEDVTATEPRISGEVDDGTTTHQASQNKKETSHDYVSENEATTASKPSDSTVPEQVSDDSASSFVASSSDQGTTSQEETAAATAADDSGAHDHEHVGARTEGAVQATEESQFTPDAQSQNPVSSASNHETTQQGGGDSDSNSDIIDTTTSELQAEANAGSANWNAVESGDAHSAPADHGHEARTRVADSHKEEETEPQSVAQESSEESEETDKEETTQQATHVLLVENKLETQKEAGPVETTSDPNDKDTETQQTEEAVDQQHTAKQQTAPAKPTPVDKEKDERKVDPMDADYVDLDKASSFGASPPPEVGSQDPSPASSQEESQSSDGEADAKEPEQLTKDDEAQSDGSSDARPLKEGSLAGFFQKGKGKEQPNLSGLETQPPTDGSATTDATTTGKPNTKAEPYHQGWGQYTGKRYADLYTLGLTFNKNLASEAEARYKKVFEPLGELVIPTLYTEIMGKALNDDGSMKPALDDDKASSSFSATDSATLDDLKERLSPNAEFVEGLDDIGKFFEGVDPPDELDVGAGGTSIQEVLMGQTTKIIMKRIVLGAQYVAKTAKAVAKRVKEYFADEEHELPKIDKEQVTKAAKWVREQSRNLWDNARDLFDDLFGGDDSFEGDEEDANYATDLEKKLKKLNVGGAA